MTPDGSAANRAVSCQHIRLVATLSATMSAGRECTRGQTAVALTRPECRAPGAFPLQGLTENSTKRD